MLTASTPKGVVTGLLEPTPKKPIPISRRFPEDDWFQMLNP